MSAMATKEAVSADAQRSAVLTSRSFELTLQVRKIDPDRLFDTL